MTTHPAELATWIEANPRDRAIDKHGFILKIGNWNEMVSHLPGTPLVGEDGGTGLGLISRGGLFRLAGPARHDDTGVAALHLFWQSLAWALEIVTGTRLDGSLPSPLTQKAQDACCTRRLAKLLSTRALLSLCYSQTGRH